VECIKKGATDVVLKDRMARLTLAIKRALEEKALREEHRRSEEALRKSEEWYRFLFQANPNSVWIYDSETLNFLAVNDTAVDHFGYSREETLRMKITDILKLKQVEGGDLPEDLETLKGTLEKGGGGSVLRKDGAIAHVEFTSHGLPFGRGTTRLLYAEDITEQMKLEAQFRQAQKMEAVGRLAGGVAHDFNNLLTIIGGYGDLIRDSIPQGSPAAEYVAEVLKASERAASLTRQLLAFSRKQVLAMRLLDMNELVASSEKMLRRLIGEDIELVAILKPDLGQVKADPSQIEQVILNLAVNSRDAMPQGGKLTIETGDIEFDESYARSHREVKPGHYVMLAVSDTGIGMDLETQKRIFEPFFTTKEKGKGTGLGLATVYGIVKQSDGCIWVYSEVGRGTTFKIYFPHVECATEEAAPPVAKAPSYRGTETILIVEDEDSVRDLVTEVLKAQGYSVLAADGGEAALTLSRKHAGDLHLIVTDVIMPKMSGKELTQQLRPLRPAAKVLYVSGYTDGAIVHHGMLEPGTAFLQKPFTPDGLLRKVREVLDA
jgi:two-component system, cell cycle sensor histidine kinase and response regulator CckA